MHRHYHRKLVYRSVFGAGPGYFLSINRQFEFPDGKLPMVFYVLLDYRTC